MEYLEACAIKRLRPDSLPEHLAHVLEEAERVIRRHAARVAGSDTEQLLLPALSATERERVNKVLLANLALECGRLEAWGGPKRHRPAIRPIEMRKEDVEAGPPLPAGPGQAGMPWEQPA